VKTVFEGEVVSVFFNPSFQNAVMVKHGDYYTVYSHLKETYVKTGQKVNTGQSLGTVYTDAATQKTEIHFEVWEGKQRLNPVSWLSR
jgi:murein DD-endopeptidase MepM/ murein hydrolase activator NlpD